MAYRSRRGSISLVARQGLVGLRMAHTYPFDDPGANSSYGPFYNLIPRCAENQSAPRVYWRKERIAFFEAVLQVIEGLVQLLEQPVELALLQAGRSINQHHFPGRRQVASISHPYSNKEICVDGQGQKEESKGYMRTYLCSLLGNYKLFRRDRWPDLDRHRKLPGITQWQASIAHEY